MDLIDFKMLKRCNEASHKYSCCDMIRGYVGPLGLTVGPVGSMILYGYVSGSQK